MFEEKSNVSFYIKQKIELMKSFVNYDKQLKDEIIKSVNRKYKNIENIFKDEERPYNGVDKYLRREKSNLFIDEIKKRLKIINDNSAGIENADGRHPGMIYIPSGKSKIGVDKGFSSREEPEKSKYIRGYWIDKYAVSNKEFHEIFPQHLPDPHSSDNDMPVVNITWFDAHKYCVALGKRLPTLIEWEKAARGKEEWIYPFGNEYKVNMVNIWPSEGTKKVTDYFPNSWGLYQMSGNVWEWTSNVFVHNLRGEKRIYYNLSKGGSWKHCKWGARATNSLCLDLSHRSENVGFRCVSY